MRTALSRKVLAVAIAGLLLLPATAMANPWAELPKTKAPHGLSSSGVQASAIEQVLTSLTKSGRLAADDYADYLLWVFPGQTLTLQLTTSSDYSLDLYDEAGELAASADELWGGGTEYLVFTNTDYTAGPQVFAIEAYAYEAGNFSLGVRMTDAPVDAGIVRLAGADRYATSVQASMDAFAAGADTVVIATGANFADALAAAGLCGVFDAPLLLVPTGSLPAVVSAEIDRLGATNAIIVGGTGAVGAAVESALNAKSALAGNVSRIAGANRYDTAKKVAEAMRAELGTDLTSAIVVNGLNFADALSASPLAFATNRPILLTPAESAHSATLAAIDSVGVSDIIIVGGTGAVGAAAEAQLEAQAGGIQASRWAGATRYDTAAAVAANSVSMGALSRGYIGYAYGLGFADGLAGGVAAGREGGVLLLTDAYVEPEATQTFNSDSAGITQQARVFGGSGVIWGNVMGMIDSDLFGAF